MDYQEICGKTSIVLLLLLLGGGLVFVISCFVFFIQYNKVRDKITNLTHSFPPNQTTDSFGLSRWTTKTETLIQKIAIVPTKQEGGSDSYQIHVLPGLATS